VATLGLAGSGFCLETGTQDISPHAKHYIDSYSPRIISTPLSPVAQIINLSVRKAPHWNGNTVAGSEDDIVPALDPKSFLIQRLTDMSFGRYSLRLTGEI
jgi:hypothetical protein